MRIFYSVAILLIMISFVVIPAAADSNDALSRSSDSLQSYTSPEYIPGQMLVKYKNNGEPTDIVNILGIAQAAEEDEKPNIIVIEVDKRTDIEALAKQYEKNPAVEYAEPNYLAQAFLAPDDLSYSTQYHHANIESSLAWNITQGNISVIIGIIDTGVDWDHPDLASNIWNNTAETNCTNGVDDDSNGFVDDCRGWDFVDNITDCYDGEDCDDRDNNPMDFHGHGTHVSGIAAAVTNNSIGVAGVCWNCKIMPLRAGFKYNNGGGYLTTADIVSALYYGADNGADIISMSFGLSSSSSSLQDAINYAYSKGVVLIAASGNSNSATRQYPAAYDNVVSVGSTDSSDAKSSFSNHGTWLDAAAPGTSINSTYFNNSYGVVSGTSMSTPMTAGIAGLILSRNSFTQEQVKTILHTAVDNLSSSVYLGTGRINAYKAVQINQSPILILNSSLDDNTTTQNLAITGTANLSFAGYNFSNYTLEYGTGLYPSAWNTIISGNSSVINGALGSWDIGSLSNGTYKLRLAVRTNQTIWKNSTANETLVFIDETFITSSNINVTLDTPANNILTDSNQAFNCSARSSNTLTNMTLYIWNSSASQTVSANIGGNSNTTSIIYNFTTSSNYTWNCLARDSSRQAFAPFNNTINVDVDGPVISFVSPTDNNSEIVHRNYTFINITAADAANVSSCILQWTNNTNISMTMIGSGQSVSCYYNETGLLDSKYNYTALVIDGFGNSGNSSQRSITIDAEPLNITNITNSSISRNSAVVSVSASEPTNSTIFYGTNITNLSNSAANNSYSSAHLAELIGLASGTTYFYNITNCDYTGNCTTTGPFNFTTLISGIEISGPGEYQMNSDYSGTPYNTSLNGTAAVIISSSDISFDCNGFSILNNGTNGTTYGIFINNSFTNITIRNCNSIANFSYGIYAYYSDNIIISNLTVLNNTVNGILLQSANNITIENSTIRLNLLDGIGMFNSSNNSFRNLRIQDNRWHGIEVYNQSRYNLFINITASNNTYDGILLSESHWNNITNSSMRGNNASGIHLFNTSGNNTIANNSIFNNNYSGINLQHNASTNTIRNNIVYSSSNGIYSSEMSSYNVFDKNTIYNNTQWGIILFNSSNYAVISNNTIYKNSQDGIILMLSSWGNITNNTIYNNTWRGIVSFNESVNNRIINNTVYNNSQYGIYAWLNSTNTTIQNNSVYENTDYGIAIQGSMYSIVSRNVVYQNVIGLYLYETYNNSLTQNRIYNSSTPGISVVSSHQNNITENNVYNNSQYGIYITGSYGLNVSNNTIAQNQIADLRLDAASAAHCNNIITNNTALGNKTILFYNNTVFIANLSNTAEIILCNADNSVVTNITMSDTDNISSNGLLILQTENLSIYNISLSNVYAGVYLYSSVNNSISYANMTDVYIGVYLSVSNNLSLSWNNLTNLSYGIYLSNSDAFFANTNYMNNISVNEIYLANGTLATGAYNISTNYLDFGISASNISLSLANLSLSGLDLTPDSISGISNLASSKIVRTSKNAYYALNATNTSGYALFTPRLYYNSSDLGDYSTDRLGIGAYNGTWIQRPSTVNTSSSSIMPSSAISSFSLFAPLVYSISTTTTPSGGGGGGGGSTASAGCLKRSFSTMPAGQNISVTGFCKASGITEMVITTKRDASDVMISVESAGISPNNMTGIDRPYRYIELETGNLDDSDILNIIIRFEVNKTWIDSEGADANNMAMSIYENGKWSVLETKRINDSDNYTNHQTYSKKLSSLAISEIYKECESGTRCSGQQLQQCVNNIWVFDKICDYGCAGNQCIGNITKADSEITMPVEEPETIDQPAPKETELPISIIAFILLIAIMFLAYYLIHKSSKPTKPKRNYDYRKRQNVKKIGKKR
ncbi:MAG: right-handed parallel beta-helix repeat-containing protein [Candidatus Aenigmarchaeota archaeon]|nr:right-handed parallel beta-helix repeat-containing protein [Candidatus Aenigmarchaeota archaeon]